MSRVLGKRRRRLKVTRQGGYFLLVTVAIGLGAINTGNNLLFLLLGWLLSAIIASGILSNLCLRGLEVSRRVPTRVFANEPFFVEIEARNNKGRVASYSLQVEDIGEGKTIDKRCYFLKLPAKKKQSASYRHTVGRRGWCHFDGIRVSTKFPFGLFEKSIVLAHKTPLLVFPETRSVTLDPTTARKVGEHLVQKVGRHGEFFALREYRDGDDRRRIHWKTSAKRRSLVIREYQDESQRQITLLLDNALPVSANEEQVEAFEEAVRVCASLAREYLQRGYAVGLITRDQTVPLSAGKQQEHRILCFLAVVVSVLDTVPFSSSVGERADALVVVPKGLVQTKNRSVTQQAEVRGGL